MALISMTLNHLNDIKRGSGRNVALYILSNSIALGPVTSKWLKIDPYFSDNNVVQRIQLYSNDLWRYLQKLLIETSALTRGTSCQRR